MIANTYITSGVIATAITTIGVVIAAWFASRNSKRLTRIDKEISPGPGQPPIGATVGAIRVMLRRHIRTAAVLEEALANDLEPDDPVRRAFSAYLQANIEILDEEDSLFSHQYLEGGDK